MVLAVVLERWLEYSYMERHEREHGGTGIYKITSFLRDSDKIKLQTSKMSKIMNPAATPYPHHRLTMESFWCGTPQNYKG